MASGEVCRALPTTAWSISAGSMPVRSKRARAACAPRSMAEMSANEPLYSAIGVRTPSTRTRSRSSISGTLPLRLSSRRGGQSMEAPAPAIDVRRGIETGTEQDEDPSPFRIDPETRTCETGVTECGGRKRPPGTGAEGPPPPAQGERAAAFQGLGHALRIQHAAGRQPFRAEPPQVAGGGEQTRMPADASAGSERDEEAGVAVLGRAHRGRPEIRNRDALPRRQLHFLASAHERHGDVRLVPRRWLDRGEAERAQEARAQQPSER